MCAFMPLTAHRVCTAAHRRVRSARGGTLQEVFKGGIPHADDLFGSFFSVGGGSGATFPGKFGLPPGRHLGTVRHWPCIPSHQPRSQIFRHADCHVGLPPGIFMAAGTRTMPPVKSPAAYGFEPGSSWPVAEATLVEFHGQAGEGEGKGVREKARNNSRVPNPEPTSIPNKQAEKKNGSCFLFRGRNFSGNCGTGFSGNPGIVAKSRPFLKARPLHSDSAV